MRAFVLALVVLVLLACGSPPPPAPPPAPAGDDPEGACATLARLGCPEAQLAAAVCPDVLRRAGELRDLRTGCIAAARDVAELRACGTVRCGR